MFCGSRDADTHAGHAAISACQLAEAVILDLDPFEVADPAWSEETDQEVLAAIAALMGEPRHFLFVCGPFGCFTRRLAARLRTEGARCSRVLLNGGDVLDWGLKDAPAFLGGFADWAGWLETYYRREAVTDIVLYADSHPYCAEARSVARAMGVRVHVLEQGYFRPFWITLERDAANTCANLPRAAADYRRAAACAPPPRRAWLPPLTPPAVRNLAAYHTAVWLASPLFPRFHLPYQYSLPRQSLGHVLRFIRQRLFRRRRQKALAAVLNAERPLFLGILQRPGDSQLRLRSRFARVADFIEAVVASFARHAPGRARLLFKAHPLDHGLEPHEAAVRAAARAHGVEARVFFADSGDLAAMLPTAAGAVTVNSTAGLLAMEQGLPTVVLGEAIYDLPGLTHQGGLDSFWRTPAAPDEDLYEAFRKVVMARSQVSGAYATRQGVDMATPEVARRLLNTNA